MALPDRFRIEITEQLNGAVVPHPVQWGACSGEKSAMTRFRRTLKIPPTIRLELAESSHREDGSSHYYFNFKANGGYLGSLHVYPN